MAAGSSPHTRGAHDVVGHLGVGDRIIPAYAGSTRDRLESPRLGSDHPRIRGEHSDLAASKSTPRGSSPHTRGAPSGSSSDRAASRIIPAYAGSTYLRPGVSGLRGGSSPHTRGARPSSAGRKPIDRIIPAYAGSTSVMVPVATWVPDHPRIRGEHNMARSRSGSPRGSSPHTRGALGQLGIAYADVGIIPAYAGSTAFLIRISIELNGSSPHTRGAPTGPFRLRRHSGIIPAYAGSTPSNVCRYDSRQDHPRIRGEHKY